MNMRKVVTTTIIQTWMKKMIKEYYDKFMIWQLHNRREIVCVAIGFVVGAIVL